MFCSVNVWTGASRERTIREIMREERASNVNGSAECRQ